MKILRFNALVFLILLISTFSYGQDDTLITKSFEVNKGAILSITNTFGDVVIDPYQGSTIEVSIRISGSDMKSKRVDDLMEKIEIITSQKDNKVVLRTDHGQSSKISFGGTRKLTVDYTVRIPAATNLIVLNMFGDIRISGTDGNVFVKSQHGDCTLGAIKGKTNKVNLMFGDLRIADVSDVEIEMQHGDIKAGKMSNVNCNHMFGDVRIESLGGESLIKLQHGDTRIERLAADLTRFNLEIMFGDAAINDLSNGSYKVLFDGQFGDFSSGNSLVTKVKEEQINRSHYVLESKENSGALIPVTISIQHGDLRLD